MKSPYPLFDTFLENKGCPKCGSWSVKTKFFDSSLDHNVWGDLVKDENIKNPEIYLKRYCECGYIWRTMCKDYKEEK